MSHLKFAIGSYVRVKPEKVKGLRIHPLSSPLGRVKKYSDHIGEQKGKFYFVRFSSTQEYILLENELGKVTELEAAIEEL